LGCLSSHSLFSKADSAALGWSLSHSTVLLSSSLWLSSSAVITASSAEESRTKTGAKEIAVSKTINNRYFEYFIEKPPSFTV
jgi:hypothetical protein